MVDLNKKELKVDLYFTNWEMLMLIKVTKGGVVAHSISLIDCSLVIELNLKMTG